MNWTLSSIDLMLASARAFRKRQVVQVRAVPYLFLEGLDPMSTLVNDRSSWPFPTLLPWSVMYNYPPPQFLRSRESAQPEDWPPRRETGYDLWRKNTDSLADPIHQIYIHVPFCPFICDFCPFYKVRNSRDDVYEAYVEAVLREIRLYARIPLVQSQTYSVIYFGGGTPTELSPVQLGRILDALKRELPVSGDVEVTLEGVARQMLAPGYLEACYERGFNRVSFGVQSLDPLVRKSIGRVGDEIEDYPRVIELSRTLSPEVAVNIEFLHGCPNQSNESLASDLREAIRWEPASIDLFSYIMMPGTSLYHQVLSGEIPPPRYGTALLEQRILGRELLTGAGYKQVAGEMFKRTDPGRFSRSFYAGHGNGAHTVLPLGPSSIGHLDGTAYRNLSNLQKYQHCVQEGRLPISSSVQLTAEQARRRALLLAVAHLEIPEALVGTRQERKCLRRWERTGLVVAEAGKWRVTEMGTLWYNQMQIELLPVRDFLFNASLLGSLAEQEQLIREDNPLGREMLAMASSYGVLPPPVMRWTYKTYLRLANRLPAAWTRGMGWLGPVRRNTEVHTIASEGAVDAYP